MRKSRGGIDEFKIARAFGVIAVTVALYGVTLSAAALVEQPAAERAEPLKWYAGCTTAGRGAALRELDHASREWAAGSKRFDGTRARRGARSGSSGKLLGASTSTAV